MSQAGEAHQRCSFTAAGDLELCDVAQDWARASVTAIEQGCWNHADAFAQKAALVAEVHRQEHQLREGRR